MKYVAGVLDGKTRSQAKAAAGFSPKLRPSDVEKNLPFEIFREAMEIQGLTVEYLVGRLREGLEATVTEAFCTREGEIKYSEPMADYPTRHKYADMAMRLSGAYPSNRDVRAEDQGQGLNLVQIVQNNMHLSDEDFLASMQRARLRLEGKQE